METETYKHLKKVPITKEKGDFLARIYLKVVKNGGKK